MITPDQLATLERLRERATRGEWHAENDYPSAEIRTQAGVYIVERGGVMGASDALYVAALQNLAPDLLATIRELQAQAKSVWMVFSVPDNEDDPEEYMTTKRTQAEAVEFARQAAEMFVENYGADAFARQLPDMTWGVYVRWARAEVLLYRYEVREINL